MDDRDELLDVVGEVLADEPVVFSYLFGSAAREDTTERSDIDIALRFRDGVDASTRTDDLLRIGVRLERALGREVDLVDLAEVPLRFAGRILTERVVVTGSDEPARVRYETDLLPRYLDFEFHARAIDAEMLAAMAAGER